MLSFQGIIKKIGVDALAAAFGVDESHVRVMKTRNSIPPEYWGVLIEKAAESGMSGIDYPHLHQLRTERFKGSAETADAESAA